MKFSLFKQLKLLIPLVVVAAACGLSAQAILTTTTLSSAMTTSNGQVINLTSATGVTAPSVTNPNAATTLFVDREAMAVEAVNSTAITVQRGAMGTTSTAHASSALVFVISNYQATKFGYIPAGSCTRSNEIVLPRIHFPSGTISDCVGGQWVQGDASQTTRAVKYRILSPETGAQSEGAAFGTSTALTQYSTYCTEIDVNYSKFVTGIAPHLGATGGTDHWIGSLYDSAGNLLFSSATTAVGSTAYSYQALPFASKYYLVGPAQYYGCVTTNGGTATLDLIATNKGDNILTQTATGTAYTVPTSITVPTSFTTLYGPYLYLY